MIEFLYMEGFMSLPKNNHSILMNDIYEKVVYIYDFTRAYYLIGRNLLLKNLPVKARYSVLEIGCGTARNLVMLANKYNDITLTGIDASSVMLEYAEKKIQKHNLQHRITLHNSLAENWIQEESYDIIIFSFSLSMIPKWQKAIKNSINSLKTSGTLAIVDFGEQQGWPNWGKNILRKWLTLFHVTPRINEIIEEIIKINGNKDNLYIQQLCNGYSAIITYKRA